MSRSLRDTPGDTKFRYMSEPARMACHHPVPKFVAIMIQAQDSARKGVCSMECGRRLCTRPIQSFAFSKDDLHGPRNDVSSRGQGNLAVALHGVAVSHGEQRARNMHGQIEVWIRRRAPCCRDFRRGDPEGPLDMRPTSGFGATPIEPKNGSQFQIDSLERIRRSLRGR